MIHDNFCSEQKVELLEGSRGEARMEWRWCQLQYLVLFFQWHTTQMDYLMKDFTNFIGVS
jgi:hypothetical protein